jgi:curved DNA-binding protein CbpA
METSEFVDFYEVLEISPNANSGTIDRMFRYFAQRYHPDNPDTGDRLQFDQVMEAYKTLSDPASRAQFDVQYRSHLSARWKVSEEAADGQFIDRDLDIRNKLLSILYVKRRQSVREPGVSNFELEGLLACPIEHLQFHLWYLKEKGWIERTETGLLAITVEGVDRASAQQDQRGSQKLLSDHGRPD